MYISEELHFYLLQLARNPLFEQLAPIAVFFLVPLIVFLFTTQAATHKNQLLWSAAMVLESLGLGLPWSWSGNNAHASGSNVHERKKSKKKHVRTRAEQATTDGHANRESPSPTNGGAVDDGYYPGLVNISGTYCFMNSTLQAMASLSYLQPHIDAIHTKAVALDVPSPVIDALRDILHELNTPKSHSTSLRPLQMISALSNHSQGKHNSLFSSREHQDAQELFQLLSECIKNEAAAVEKEEYRDRGLGGLGLMAQSGSDNGAGKGKEDGSGGIGKSMFDGLTANRRSCMECGYTEAVMHFAFDNWQLAVPRMTAGCELEACLADYTRLELLTDCICRKCSLLATQKRLAQEAERLAEALNVDPNPSTSKKKRVKEAKKLETRVKLALEEGRIEDDIKGVKMDKVFSKASTKQAMIARPPPVLALHLNRSIHSGHYAAKNNVRIFFPEILDLTSFTTSGNLSTVPSIPISTPPPSIPRSTTPTPATYAIPRTIYRLSAVVCHYGQHSFGHYICFRRKPRPVSTGNAAARFAPPKLADPLGCECEKCERFGPVRDDDDDALNAERTRRGHGWLRISDESVKECGIETVLQEGSGAFMLYYERVVQSRPGIYPLAASPRSSEETLKPLTVGLVADANLSTASLATVGNGVVPMGAKEERKPRVLGPRIVRSVAPARGRSVSAAPSERESMFVCSREGSTLKGDEPHVGNGNAKPLSASMMSTSAPLHHPEADISASLPNLPLPAAPPTPPLPPLEEAIPLTPTLVSPCPPLTSPLHNVQAPQPMHPGQPQMVGLRV